MNQSEQKMTAIPAQYYIHESEQHDEIDLYELISSIVKQWKLILIISFVGTMLGLFYSYSLSKQYENYIQIRAPLNSDLQILELNGYGIELKSMFLQFHDNLKSPENFKNYLISSNYVTQFYPEITSQEDIDLATLGLSSDFEVTFIDNENNKTESGDESRIIEIRLKSSNEDVAIKVLNQYVVNVEQDTLKLIRERSKYTINLRKQEIENEITTLRNLAKQTRLNSIADLKETLKVAHIMGVRDALFTVPSSKSKTKTLNLFLNNQVNQFQKYMLGSDYLTAEINRLESRKYGETADDAFIPKMPKLLSELSNLNKKSLKFDGAKLYTLDKLAAKNDASVKPNKKLIVIIGMLLSGFLALFVALITSTIQKRKNSESSNNTVS